MSIITAFNNSEDSFPPVDDEYGRIYRPFGFPAALPDNRPYTTSNFVTGLDGKASYSIPGKAGGKEVSRSKADGWLFNFLLAHHDAGMIGADTLRKEPGADGLGGDLHIQPEILAKYWRRLTGLDKQRIFIVSGSGRINLGFHMFNSDLVEAWIVTSSVGAKALEEQMSKRSIRPKLLIVGDSPRIDLKELFRVLRQEHGIKTLHCMGGPTLHGQIIENNLLDEAFLTVSSQIMGKSTEPDIERPTAFGNLSFVPETAPWFNTISLHYEIEEVEGLKKVYHTFYRLRYEGPRKFDD